MRILSRYYTLEFFKLLLLCLITFLSIYFIIDFLQKIDNFFEAQVSKSVMMSYFLYKAPFVIIQMLPPAILISTVIMFCLMKRNNEINAVKACGLSILRLSQPVIMASIFIGIAIFLFSEIIVPYASSRSNEIWNIEVEKQDPTRFYGSNQVWYRGSDSIYWMMRFDNKKKIMESPTFYFFDKAFRMIKRIDGQKGFWEKGRWRIENGAIQEAIKDGGYELKKFDELYLQIPETPKTFVRAVKSPEEMSYWELKRYTKKVRQEGYDETRYLVDMNIKVAYPLISLVFVLIGIPIALSLKKGGTPLAVSIGIGICFLYMLTLGFSRSLGLSGVLPPILSAWLANMIFFFLGIYLMLHVER